MTALSNLPPVREDADPDVRAGALRHLTMLREILGAEHSVHPRTTTDCKRVVIALREWADAMDKLAGELWHEDELVDVRAEVESMRHHASDLEVTMRNMVASKTIVNDEN